MPNDDTTRRRFLAAGLTATTVGLAGCEGGDIPDEETPTPDDSLDLGNRWVAHHGMTSSEYQDKFDEYVGKGYRLTDVSGYGVDGEARYAAIWEAIAGPAWKAHHGLTGSEFEDKFNQYDNQGYRTTAFSGYSVGGEARYAAIWEQYSGPAWKLYYGMSSSGYQNRFDRYQDDGFRPTTVSGYAPGGDRYGVIWQQFGGPAWQARHRLTGSKYQETFDEFVDQGYRLTDVSGYEVDGEARYAAVWQKFSGPAWRTHHGMTGSKYQEKFEEYVEDGYRLTTVSGYAVGGEPRFAAIWRKDEDSQEDFGGIDAEVADYMGQHGVPGLSLAIAKDERLVFAKGYGHANLEANELARPDHRFRIASISKPITGVAIQTLVEDGKLALDDTVFGSGGIFGTTYGTPTHGYDAEKKQITVHHLLQHASGWVASHEDNDVNYPMFENPGMSHDELISWVLDERELLFQPGSNSGYSNFGYCVLGRVIETVSGQAYEDYVRQAVLQPSGVDGMAIAGDSRTERGDDEAAYYGGNPYGMPVARMDSHGGWTASPTDLLRFLVRMDGFDGKTDLLGTDAMTELSDSDGFNGGYGEGWMLGGNWRGHNGAFDGTVGYLVRRDDGISFAVVTNTRPSNDGSAGGLKSRLDNLLGNVDDWPSHDLF